jgi:hypothetical protein
VLAARWACLAEDKRALAAAERRLASLQAGGGGGDSPDFEPGALKLKTHDALAVCFPLTWSRRGPFYSLHTAGPYPQTHTHNTPLWAPTQQTTNNRRGARAPPVLRDRRAPGGHPLVLLLLPALMMLLCH